MRRNSPGPRETIKNFPPYAAGMSIEQVKEQYGLDRVIKLASNENLWGPSHLALDEIKKELDNLHIYPQSRPAALIKAISGRLSVSEDSVLTANGTDEIIELIAKTFLGENDKVVVSENSFIRYKMAGNLMGAEVIEVPQKSFKIDLEGILKEIDAGTKVVYIDNPCNPTGTFVTGEEIENFISGVGNLEKPPVVVFDEAYYEYASDSSYSSALRFLSKDIPLMVLRTFSKIYGLAGLRIGYGIAGSEIISLISRITPPFNTNRLAQAGAAGAYKDEVYVKKIAEKTKVEKNYLYKEFDRLKLSYVCSQTNFILVKFGVENVRELCEYLLKAGIILRPLAGYDLNDYIRITIGKRQHNEELISGIEKFLKSK